MDSGNADGVGDVEAVRYARMNAQRRRSHLAPQSLRAGWWAARALRRTRRDLKEQGLQARVSPAPPAVPWGNRTGVMAVLNRVQPTCLERALVLQTWLASHEIHCDVVVGVLGSGDGVRAHAWVDGITPDEESHKYREIHRLPPREPV